MLRVYIWGTGHYANEVLKTINKDTCNVLGFIDNDPNKQGDTFAGKMIYSFKDILKEYDYIVVSVKKYEAVLYMLELEEYVEWQKLIIFFDRSCMEKRDMEHVMDVASWKIILLEEKVKELEKKLEYRINNIEYEIVDKFQNGKYWYPKMGTVCDAIEKITQKGCSLIRFGDGEFEIMAGRERPVYQKYNATLSDKLRKVISVKDDRILIGIANNYGDIDQYSEEVADGIRRYMTDEVRDFHRKVLYDDKVYYDAYMFKCYFPYRDKSATAQRMEMIKKIWNGREVVLIEGSETRTGYGNDLFDNAKSVQRLLAPTRNAFEVYERIFDCAKKIEKNKLILMVLGPAGKVLAYDLIQIGFQVIDIGQIDMDYEWYRVGRNIKVPIPTKYVSQLPPAEIRNVTDEEYLEQIIEEIE